MAETGHAKDAASLSGTKGALENDVPMKHDEAALPEGQGILAHC
jgi:hypothetical protein